MSDGSLIFNTKVDTEGVKTGLLSIGKIAAGVFGGQLLTKTFEGLANLGRQAIFSFASVEQSIGGIETLYKDAADEMIANSKKAYTEAGISANDYMETATSFSASLIQSTAGDTAKAAKYADMAIKDMSDNANKMGTDISAIQTAYQGFAKQNYTMLDNLKLGYGGTKEEMERLLKDAEKITGIHYDIKNLNDVYNAIHVIQGGVDELNGGLGDVSKGLGISGATAAEAMNTVEGAMKMMKSSWQDLLAGMGGEEDVGPLVDNFVKSAGAVWKNVKPVIIRYGQNIPQLLAAAMKGLAKEFPAIRPIAATFDFLGEHIDAVVPIVLALVAGIAAFNSAIAISTAVSSAVQAIKAYQAANKGATVAQAILNQTILANPYALLIAAIVAVVAALIYLWNTNEEFRKFVIGTWNEIVEFFTTMPARFSEWITGVIEHLSKFVEDMDEKARQAATGFFNQITSGLASLPGKMYDVGSNIVRGIWNGISSGWNWLTNKVADLANNLFNSAKNALGIHSPSKKFQFLGEMCVAGFDKGLDGIDSELSSFRNSVEASLTVQTAGVPSGGVPQSGNTFNFYDTQTSPDAIQRRVENTMTFGLAGGLD